MNQNLPARKTKDDFKDRVERYYLNEGKLSAEDKKICERIELAYAMLSHHKIKKLAVTKYLAVMKQKGNEISMPTAYNDFRLAEEIFVPLQKYSKEFLRLMIIESAQADIKRLESKLAKCNDDRQYTTLMAQKDRCRETIIKAGGLMQDDSRIPDFDKVQPIDIQVNISERDMKLLEKITKVGSMDLSEIFEIDDAEILNDGQDQEDN